MSVPANCASTGKAARGWPNPPSTRDPIGTFRRGCHSRGVSERNAITQGPAGAVFKQLSIGRCRRPTADVLHFAGFEIVVIETLRADFFLNALLLGRVVILDHLYPPPDDRLSSVVSEICVELKAAIALLFRLFRLTIEVWHLIEARSWRCATSIADTDLT